MGSELSSLILVPLVGVGASILGILAVVEQNKDNETNARWLAIATVVVLILLIIVNIVLTIVAA